MLSKRCSSGLVKEILPSTDQNVCSTKQRWSFSGPSSPQKEHRQIQRKLARSKKPNHRQMHRNAEVFFLWPSTAPDTSCFATVAASLWELTKPKAKWTWTDEHQACFDKLKELLSSDTVLAYFDPELKSCIVVDAIKPSRTRGYLYAGNQERKQKCCVLCQSNSHSSRTTIFANRT